MPLCFGLFGRTQQVSQDGKSRKVRRMMPLEAGPVWLWGGLIKKYPIFISLDDSPTKKKCQVYRGKFQVYSTCDNQAILPSDAIFWAHPQFWWIYTLVYVASIILKLDETRFSHWDEVIRCWFVTCWPHPKTRFQNCKRNAISLIWWMAQTIFPAERLLCAHKFDHMSNFHSGSKLW